MHVDELSQVTNIWIAFAPATGEVIAYDSDPDKLDEKLQALGVDKSSVVLQYNQDWSGDICPSYIDDGVAPLPDPVD